MRPRLDATRYLCQQQNSRTEQTFRRIRRGPKTRTCSPLPFRSEAISKSGSPDEIEFVAPCSSLLLHQLQLCVRLRIAAFFRWGAALGKVASADLALSSLGIRWSCTANRARPVPINYIEEPRHSRAPVTGGHAEQDQCTNTCWGSAYMTPRVNSASRRSNANMHALSGHGTTP
jgi:hypothetical protein